MLINEDPKFQYQGQTSKTLPLGRQEWEDQASQLENNINEKKERICRLEHTWCVIQIKRKKKSDNPFTYFIYSANILWQLQNAATLLMLWFNDE